MVLSKINLNGLVESETRALIEEAFSRIALDGKRVLILIPDRTRTAPIPLMFKLFFDALSNRVRNLDYLVALGTHRPLAEEGLNQLIGVDEKARSGRYRDVRVMNHRWDLPESFVTLGHISASEIADLTGGLLNEPIDVRLNRLIFEYDHLVVCGPTFPHEVVGFSGGNKYFFPGIAGSEVINFSHWLGALITSNAVIGSKYTRVRKLIDRAASMIDRPKSCFSLVVSGEKLAGVFFGTPEEAYDAAAELSSQIHIKWLEHPVDRVLSVMPTMYEDIWTAAKGMYKLEPIVRDGGEVVIYAPHITEISYSHGKLLEEIGYHTRDYFLKQWERFKDYPGGILAHSTHLRGLGTFDVKSGVETPRISVTLATGISRERCENINLGYMNPADIDLKDWVGRENEGILMVPPAGELLYRLKSDEEDQGRAMISALSN